jgi:hypothetical protein
VPLRERRGEVNGLARTKSHRAGKSIASAATDWFAMRRERGNATRYIMRVWIVSLAALMAAGLAGCVGAESRYPSLALRDFETSPLAAAATASGAVPLPEPRPVDTARIAALRAAAETSSAEFSRREPSAATLVARARGQSAESDARARALVALADLSSRRSATFLHLGDLDLLAADTAIDFGWTQNIEAARSDVLTMVEQQDRALSALWTEMGQ